VTALILIFLLSCPAVAMAEDAPPNAELRQALRDSARVVLREGKKLLRLGQTGGPRSASLREGGLRLIERAGMMSAAAGELSAQMEQAARSVRQESAALVALAERMRSGEGPLPEVARRLLAESERLKMAASQAPVVEPGVPFEGLATGVNKI
jgi:hypothetical protein